MCWYMQGCEAPVLYTILLNLLNLFSYLAFKFQICLHYPSNLTNWKSLLVALVLDSDTDFNIIIIG